MKASNKTLLTIALISLGVSAAVVYASNNIPTIKQYIG